MRSTCVTTTVAKSQPLSQQSNCLLRALYIYATQKLFQYPFPARSNWATSPLYSFAFGFSCFNMASATILR